MCVCVYSKKNYSQALLAFIDAHNVDQLALFTRELSASGHGDLWSFIFGFLNNNYFSVSVLFQFATVLRSLYIYQSHFAEIERLNSNYFLGFVDEDWAAIILEMFSRKLDKLFIDNHSCPKYLSVNNIAFLNEVWQLKISVLGLHVRNRYSRQMQGNTAFFSTDSLAFF